MLILHLCIRALITNNTFAWMKEPMIIQRTWVPPPPSCLPLQSSSLYLSLPGCLCFLLFYLCISTTSVLFSFPFPLEVEACFPSQILHTFLLVQTIKLKVGEFLRPSIVSLLTLRSTLATTWRHSFTRSCTAIKSSFLYLNSFRNANGIYVCWMLWIMTH